MGKYFKYCKPILKVMQDQKEYGVSDLIPLVSDIMNLSEQERNEKHSSGQTKLYNNISWAKMHLKKACLIEKSYKTKYKISIAGLNVLVENPEKINSKYLKRFPCYIDYINGKQTKQSNQSNKKPPNISDLWQILQSKLDCDIRQQGSYYSLFYNNKRFGILCVQKKSIKITYTLPNLQHIMPNTVSKSTSPYVKDPKTGKHDGFDQRIKDMNDINIAVDIINKIKSIINKSNNGISTKSNEKGTMRTPIIEKQTKNNIKNELLEKMKSMPSDKFEILVLDLLKEMKQGIKYVHLGKPGDHGIDGEIWINESGSTKIIGVQVKQYKNSIQEKDLSSFYGALKNKYTSGIFVTLSKFTKNAKKNAYNNNILTIINGQELIKHLIDYEIGVRKVIDDDYFSSI